MSSKPKDNLLNKKDYLFLTVCLIIFFTGGSYFLAGGDIPKDMNIIYLWIAGVIIAIPIVIYILKNIK